MNTKTRVYNCFCKFDYVQFVLKLTVCTGADGITTNCLAN